MVFARPLRIGAYLRRKADRAEFLLLPKHIRKVCVCVPINRPEVRTLWRRRKRVYCDLPFCLYSAPCRIGGSRPSISAR